MSFNTFEWGPFASTRKRSACHSCRTRRVRCDGSNAHCETFEKTDKQRENPRKSSRREIAPTEAGHLRSYMEHIFPFYPMFYLRDLQSWIRCVIERRRAIKSQQHLKAGSEEPRKLVPQDAVVLLVFALGEAVAFTNGKGKRVTATRGQSIPFSSAHYEEAVQTIKDHEDVDDIYHAQKMLLAGHYNMLLGREDSVEFLKRADTVLRSLLNERNPLFQEDVTGLLTKSGIDVNSDVESSRKLFRRHHVENEKKMAEDSQRLIVMAAWTCLRISRNSFPTEYKQMTDLWKIEDLLPTPSMFPGKSVCRVASPYRTTDRRSDENKSISDFYQALTSIERLLEQICTGTHRNNTHSLSGQALRNLLERYREDVNKWREILPKDLRWNNQSALPLNTMRARLEEIYRETMRKIDGCLPEEISH